MASIISGYEYDIFISYRQKHNKGDRWVSKFFRALMTRLKPEFTDGFSVYFVINRPDGFLETPCIRISLNERLKYLYLIPIGKISSK